MEGVPYFPEFTPDDNPESSKDKKDKKGSKLKKLPLFEKPETEPKDKKSFEFFKDDKPEKKENDKEVPLESLAADEKQTVTEQYIAARTEEVAEELADVADDSPDKAAVLANAALLENLHEKLDDSEPITAELLDEAVAETIEELGFDEEPGAEAENASSSEDAESEPADAELAPDEAEDADEPSAPASTPPSTSSTAPPPPPPPPAAHTTSASGGGVPPSGASAAFVPVASTPNILVVPSRKRERTNLLVGGILGYMIGRRRGRIKTEKRLLPIQEKLKKEVIDLHGQIAEREEKIRKLAYEHAVNKPVVKEQIAERIQEKLETKKHKQARPEKLGKVAVLAERPPEKGVELTAKKTPEKPKSASLMTVPELVSIAANIPIEQSTVKRLHETNRLSDEGLRRIVQAYLSGERYEKIVKDNLRKAESSPEMYNHGRENRKQEAHDPHQALKQALQDQGTGTNFALPALNKTMPADEYNPYLSSHNKKSKPVNVIAPVAAVAIVLTIVLIIFMSR